MDGAAVAPRERAIEVPPALVGPVEAVVRSPILALAPAVLLVFLAVVLAGVRSPVYTSRASINVGRVDVPAFTLQGVTIGNATLALGYARFVSAPPVVAAAAGAAHVSTDDAASRISASPVPNSTLIVVEAKGSSKQQAQQLANGTALGLIRYVRDLTARQQQSGVLHSFRDALAATQARLEILQSLERTHSPSSPLVRQAQLDYQTAKLREQSVGQRYLSQEVSPAPQNLLQLAVPATSASSDLVSVLERMALIAVAVGLVLGVAMALWVANRALLIRLRTWG
jgi:capsular polysaccharide biosynthesis protein